MNSQIAVTLTPNDFDRRSKGFSMPEPVWKTAVSVVERTGCRMNVFSGFDKRTATEFARHLRQALQREVVLDEERQVLDGLADFLTGQGAGGCVLSRRMWNQVWH